jgi:hypothetical protein
VDERRHEWEGIGSVVEDAEPVLVAAGIVLTRWRHQFLEVGCRRSRLASVVRVVEVHEGPRLKRKSAR